MMKEVSRRSFLKGVGAVGSGEFLLLTNQFQPGTGTRTSRCFQLCFREQDERPVCADSQCFCSFNGGQDWHSFAQEPRVACPGKIGGSILRLGAAPANFDDRRAYWDFIEYCLRQWHLERRHNPRWTPSASR